MKKAILLAMILMLLCSCASPSATPASQASQEPMPPLQVSETRVIKWLVPKFGGGDLYTPGQAADEVLAAINEKLLGGLGAKLELVVMPGERYESYANDLHVILASGEEYDLIHVMLLMGASIDSWGESGIIRDIGEEVTKYPAVVDAISSETLELQKHNGRNYGLPVYPIDIFNKMLPQITMRRSSLASLGNPEITTAEEFIAAVTGAGEAKQSSLVVLPFEATPLYAFHRTYPEYPFMVDSDSLFVFDVQGGVEAYAKSSIIEQDNRITSAIAEAGSLGASFYVINDGDTFQSYTQKWSQFAGLMHMGFNNSYSFISQNPGELMTVVLQPDAPNVRCMPSFRAMNVIPASSEDFFGLKLLEWMYASQENYDLASYGIIGKHYEITSEGTLDRTLNKDNAAFLRSLIYVDKYWRNLSGLPEYDALWDQSNARTLENMPWDGFIFDSTPVQAQYDKLMASYTNILRIKNGLSTLDRLPQEVAYAEADGLTEVLEECRRQYSEYLRVKGRLR